MRNERAKRAESLEAVTHTHTHTHTFIQVYRRIGGQSGERERERDCPTIERNKTTKNR